MLTRIFIQRFEFQEKCTIGKLFLDGVDLGIFTLEDKRRPLGEKVFGQTAIPEGIYEVIITLSNHFKRELPLLLSVPQFDGVRIHPGNTDADTEGCILVGKTWAGGDFIGHSKEAFEELFGFLKTAEKIELEITG